MARVLLVDDNLALAENLAEILKDSGHDVVVSGSGAHALREVRASCFDVAVLDVVMPHMDGLALARQLATDAPGLPTVFMSGFSDEEQRAAAERMSGRPILDKPLDILNLLALVDSAA